MANGTHNRRAESADEPAGKREVMLRGANLKLIVTEDVKLSFRRSSSYAISKAARRYIPAVSICSGINSTVGRAVT